MPAAEVEAALRARRRRGTAGGRSRLFDVYTGEQAGEGRKSLAYTLRFRAPDRTLTAEEATAARDAAVAEAGRRVGAVLRAASCWASCWGPGPPVGVPSGSGATGADWPQQPAGGGTVHGARRHHQPGHQEQRVQRHGGAPQRPAAPLRSASAIVPVTNVPTGKVRLHQVSANATSRGAGYAAVREVASAIHNTANPHTGTP